MSNLPRWSIPLIIVLAAGMTGCIERQMRKMEAKETKPRQDVLQKSEDVLRSHYYEVRRMSPEHVVALSPIDIVGNTPQRQRIDVYVFLENGYYMPSVYVQTYMNVADPPAQKAGLVSPRFPIEKPLIPAPDEDWRAIAYDQNLALTLRNEILQKLSIPAVSKGEQAPAASQPSPAATPPAPAPATAPAQQGPTI